MERAYTKMYQRYSHTLRTAFAQSPIVVWKEPRTDAWLITANQKIGAWVRSAILDPNIKDVVVFTRDAYHAQKLCSFVRDEIIKGGYVGEQCFEIFNKETIRLQSGTTMKFLPISSRLCRGLTFDWCIVLTAEEHVGEVTKHFFTDIVPVLQMKDTRLVVYTVKSDIELPDVLLKHATVFYDAMTVANATTVDIHTTFLSRQKMDQLKQIYVGNPEDEIREFTDKLSLVLKLCPSVDLRVANGLDPLKFKRVLCAREDTPENRRKLEDQVEADTVVAFVVDDEGKLFMFAH